MIAIKRYTSGLKNEWNSFCNNAKNSLFMFNRDFMEYHADRFEDFSLMFYNDDELIALLPMNIKDSCLYSHGGLTYGGFITSCSMKQHTMNECFVALMDFVKSQGICKIYYKVIPHIYHSQCAEEDLYSLFLNNAKCIKIEPSTTLNLKVPLKMPKGRKAQIGRAKREGVEIRESEDFDSFIALENEVLNAYHKTKAVHTGAELTLLHSRFPENIKLYAAIHNNKMIAGTVVFIYSSVVHTQYMAANEEARTIGALDYAVHTVIETYRESKQWLDFGISSEECGHILNIGLIAQKEGFGGRTTVYTQWEIDL